MFRYWLRSSFEYPRLEIKRWSQHKIRISINAVFTRVNFEYVAFHMIQGPFAQLVVLRGYSRASRKHITCVMTLYYAERGNQSNICFKNVA